ncbi:MAG: hypothetical protein K0R29_477 [Pseudobdellovibrio sp.]|nr:hypothetical protein [Pseudobdellovibrio sp.]
MDDKYHKAPNAKEMYSRFKQRIKHQPTEVQIDRWEYEGGTVPREADQAYLHTLSIKEKVKQYAEMVWKFFHKPFFTIKS